MIPGINDGIGFAGHSGLPACHCLFPAPKKHPDYTH